jgi:hypothetical protein
LDSYIFEPTDEIQPLAMEKKLTTMSIYGSLIVDKEHRTISYKNEQPVPTHLGFSIPRATDICTFKLD